MKRTRTVRKQRPKDEAMPSEYRFDYSKARANRFAGRIKPGSLLVVIEPDVAKVFSTPDAVNARLRALIEAMPKKKARSTG
jgi:hypothetical protein